MLQGLRTNKMKCQKHQKQSVGTCQWCGKLLCKECIGKTNAKKMYCKECSVQIGEHIQRRQLEQIKKERETEQKQKKYADIFRKY